MKLRLDEEGGRDVGPLGVDAPGTYDFTAGEALLAAQRKSHEE